MAKYFNSGEIVMLRGIDQLRMTKIFDAPNLAFFDNVGVRSMLSSGEGDPSGDRSVIYCRVDDIEVAHSDLTANGVEFQDAPHVIHSSDGYELRMAFSMIPTVISWR